MPVEQAANSRCLRLLESQQYEAAVETLERIRSVEPYDVSVWFMLGQAMCPGPPGGCGGLFLGLRFTVASVGTSDTTIAGVAAGCRWKRLPTHGLPRSPRRLHSGADEPRSRIASWLIMTRQ